jgi:hypothetical protein
MYFDNPEVSLARVNLLPRFGQWRCFYSRLLASVIATRTTHTDPNLPYRTNRVPCIFRFHELPTEFLGLAARSVGMATRQASRAWKDGYGHLDCPLTIPGVCTKDDLDSLLTLEPRRFHSIPSVTLPAAEPANTTTYPATFLEALPSAFPSLQSLSLSKHRTAAAADLSHLAPLATSLTALHLPAIIGPVAATTSASSLLPFTLLRSLSLDICLLADPPAETLQQFSCLQALRHLEWRNHNEPLPAAEWFTILGTLDLTSLVIEPSLYNWDEGALATLATACPGLSALSLTLAFVHLPEAPSTDAAPMADVVATLGRRTALTSLQLDTYFFDPAVSLRALSNLQLSSFAAGVRNEDALTNLMAPLEDMATLTALRLFPSPVHGAPDTYDACLETYEALQEVTGELDSLHLSGIRICAEDCFYGGLRALIECWDELTELRLGVVDGLSRDLRSAGICELSPLEELTNLQVLDVMCAAGDLSKTIKAVRGLPGLRELSLSANDWHFDGLVPDEHLLELQSLHPSLTRLVLGSLAASRVSMLSGPGLAVVGSLTRLQQLKLSNLQALDGPAWHEHLLPLPASLTKLELEGAELHPDVRKALKDAADLQFAVFKVGAWV